MSEDRSAVPRSIPPRKKRRSERDLATWRAVNEFADPSKPLHVRIREETGNGAAIMHLCMQILDGRIPASPSDRMQAGKILLERGWGKAPEITVSVDGGSVHGAESISSETLEVLARSLSRPLAATSAVVDATPVAIPSDTEPEPST